MPNTREKEEKKNKKYKLFAVHKNNSFLFLMDMMLGVLLVAENCARIKGAGKIKRTKNIKIGKLRKIYSNTNSVRYELNSQYREEKKLYTCMRYR